MYRQLGLQLRILFHNRSLDALHLALISHVLYIDMVTNFMNPAIISVPSWSLCVRTLSARWRLCLLWPHSRHMLSSLWDYHFVFESMRWSYSPDLEWLHCQAVRFIGSDHKHYHWVHYHLDIIPAECTSVRRRGFNYSTRSLCYDSEQRKLVLSSGGGK